MVPEREMRMLVEIGQHMMLGDQMYKHYSQSTKKQVSKLKQSRSNIRTQSLEQKPHHQLRMAARQTAINKKCKNQKIHKKREHNRDKKPNTPNEQ